MENILKQQPENIQLSSTQDAVIILDQTKLPSEVSYLTLRTAPEFYDAVKKLKVRGAPAIGICAAFAMYVLARQIHVEDASSFLAEVHKIKEYLSAARPTAVNLNWALERMEQVAIRCKPYPRERILAAMRRECIAVQQEDMQMCRSIAEHGLSLLHEGDGVLTHCNAGPLATSCYGTALGPLILAKERGIDLHVFADETRPLLQGARLTAYELQKAGVDVTLICDNMAGMVMKNGWVQACFVGCDRIAANGDTANKIGTNSVAVLARYYHIPFYVLGPTSTIDLACATGEDIPIEQRPPEEIKELFFEKPQALPEIKCYNPAFDVTDHTLITAIVTEKGICKPPYDLSLRRLFQKT